LTTDLRRNLCAQFCRYYKPGRKDELTCIGFRVVERFEEKGKKISFEKSGKKLSSSTRDILLRHLCIRCPFYEQDCDFADRQSSEPCGGFTLLGNLLEEKIVSIDDIENII
jgi:hypothetical protein